MWLFKLFFILHTIFPTCYLFSFLFLFFSDSSPFCCPPSLPPFIRQKRIANLFHPVTSLSLTPPPFLLLLFYLPSSLPFLRPRAWLSRWEMLCYGSWALGWKWSSLGEPVMQLVVLFNCMRPPCPSILLRVFPCFDHRVIIFFCLFASPSIWLHFTSSNERV